MFFFMNSYVPIVTGFDDVDFCGEWGEKCDYVAWVRAAMTST
jgi:hypothetical protein